jgi:hypothetical protein
MPCGLRPCGLGLNSATSSTTALCGRAAGLVAPNLRRDEDRRAPRGGKSVVGPEHGLVGADGACHRG